MADGFSEMFIHNTKTTFLVVEKKKSEKEKTIQFKVL